MREGWDITVPGAHGTKLELEERVEAWNRFDVEGETNIQGLPTTAAGAVAAAATETSSGAGRPKL
jgi:hypothetical protein